MKTITFSLPDRTNISENEVRIRFASQLYSDEKLTLGQAAELAGLSKSSFIEILGTYKISIFNYTPEDLEADIANVKNYRI